MKKSIMVGIMALALAASSNVGYAAETKLKTDNDKLSYTLGIIMGTNFKHQDLSINSSAFNQGLNDGLKGAKPALLPEELQKIITLFNSQMMQKAWIKMQQQALANAQASEQFLAANAKKPGVKITASGLQYQEIETGNGPKPTSTDIVEVDYECKFIDGTIFDSSYQRGKPATFALNKVLPGWIEALQMMPVGSTWNLYIPANLAYGEAGSLGTVGPQQALIFKVHLIAIQKPGAASDSGDIASTSDDSKNTSKASKP